jgi:cell division protein FtsB
MKKSISELIVGRLQQSYRQEHVIQELLNQYTRQVEQLYAYQKKMKELKKKEGRLNHKIDNTKKSIDESIYVLTKVLD